MKTIELGNLGITIHWDGVNRRSAKISSSLSEGVPASNIGYLAAMDGVESMVLAQFCEGIDVTTSAYIEATMAACHAIINHFSDEPEYKIAIHVEGGVVKSVLTNDDAMPNVSVFEFDFDTDDVDESEETVVKHWDGYEATAIVVKHDIQTNPVFDLDCVFGAKGVV